jgi:hypothetical protein
MFWKGRTAIDGFVRQCEARRRFGGTCVRFHGASVQGQGVNAHWLGDVLQGHRAEIADLEIEPRLDLTIGVLRKVDRAGLGDALKPSGDIDPVAHQVAVGLLDHVADMDPDAIFDSLFRRQASVAFGQTALDFDGATHRVHYAAKLGNCAVAGALDDRPGTSLSAIKIFKPRKGANLSVARRLRRGIDSWTICAASSQLFSKGMSVNRSASLGCLTPTCSSDPSKRAPISEPLSTTEL